MLRRGDHRIQVSLTQKEQLGRIQPGDAKFMPAYLQALEIWLRELPNLSDDPTCRPELLEGLWNCVAGLAPTKHVAKEGTTRRVLPSSLLARWCSCRTGRCPTSSRPRSRTSPPPARCRSSTS